jgi:hypothetical protein
MSQQITLHRAVHVVQRRHEFPESDTSMGFFTLVFVVTDEKGNETTITILSDTELRVGDES